MSTQFAFQQIHPGVVLKEELEARNLSANAFALRLRVPPQRIQDIVAGRRGISPETALRLEASIGTPARLWLNMQAAYDQTGRASCRERVCQDGWISVVAVHFKKKNRNNTAAKR